MYRGVRRSGHQAGVDPIRKAPDAARREGGRAGEAQRSPNWGNEPIKPSLDAQILTQNGNIGTLFWAKRPGYEGDRVVASQNQHNLYWDAESGVIVRLATHEVGGKLTRIAVLLRLYDGVTALDADSQELKDAWVVPVAQLHLHVLAFQRFVRFGDRVCVVAGAYRNRHAHVIGIAQDKAQLRLLPPSSNSTSESPALDLELPLRLVATDFRCGDVVWIIQGPHKGKTGLVIDIHVGGSISFYQVSRRLHIRTWEAGAGPWSHSSRRTQTVNAPDPKYPKIDDLELDWKDALGADQLVPFGDDDSNPSPVIRIPTNSIVFERFDHSDVQLSIQADDLWAVLERKQKARRQELKDSEHWLIGMSVQVVGKHPLKGMCGIVLGYSWLTTRADPKHHKPDYSQLQLQINIDQRTSRDTVLFKSVVEPRSRLPLDQAIIVGDTQESLVLQARVVTPPPSPSPPPMPPPPQDACYTPSLVKKRIDVKVVDELSRRFSRLAQEMSLQMTSEILLNPYLYSWHPWETGTCIRGFETHGFFTRVPVQTSAGMATRGYLVPLERPLKENQIHKDFIGVMCNNKWTVFPIPALTPCRTMLEGQSISDVQGRVIIIGPNIVGYRTHVGQYAEVLPGQTSWPG
ncbi:hypothetical protein C8F01DRAFT_1088619 [Mycena amicta]|nr:hypothetical protein C8F01DRAFT_1088619 [Mycena amicta]